MPVRSFLPQMLETRKKDKCVLRNVLFDLICAQQAPPTKKTLQALHCRVRGRVQQTWANDCSVTQSVTQSLIKSATKSGTQSGTQS